MAAFGKFIPESGEVKSFMSRFIQDEKTLQGVQIEREVRKYYKNHSLRELYAEINETLPFGSGPLNDLIHDHIFHTFNRIEGDNLESVGSRERADKLIEAFQLYQKAASQIYSSSPESMQRFPLKLLENMLSWHNHCSRNAPADFVVVSDIDSFSHGENNSGTILTKLSHIASSNGKAFLLDEKKKIAGLLYQLVFTQEGYPYRQIAERGCSSLDYFMGHYVCKDGFSPHQNIVMTYLSGIKKKNKRPYCRISDTNTHWLVKLDFSKEGYNPED